MQRSFAIVFPGQGSQSVGMLEADWTRYEFLEALLRTASDVLGYDLGRLIQEGPAEQLNETQYTQPAMLVADIARWKIWQEEIGREPAFFAGHSLGEFAALAAAEVLSFEEAVKLVAQRAALMQKAVPIGQGAMGVVLGLEAEQVTTACEKAWHPDAPSVWPVNFNSPGQVVIAGETAAVEKALGNAQEMGAKRAKLLPVSVPAHCELMRPAAEEFAKVLDQFTFHLPAVPVIQNASTRVERDVPAMKAALVRQLYSPVHWVETVQTFVENNISLIVECGPGQVLTGLNKRIAPQVEAHTFRDEDDVKSMQSLLVQRGM